MNKTLLSIIVIAVIVGGGAFYSGMKYAENKSVLDRQQRFGQTVGTNIGGQSGFRGGQRGGGGLVSGDIISKDSQSITIKMRDGGSKIVFFSDSTKISKSVDGSLKDLEIGKNISANGNDNSDGSITAQSIQIRP